MDLSRPPPDLGMRVYRELCGHEVFREMGDSSSARSRIGPALLRRRATVRDTAKLLGISVGAVYKIAKAYRSGGEAAVRPCAGAKGARSRTSSSPRWRSSTWSPGLRSRRRSGRR